jgi:hypothetical protein
MGTVKGRSRVMSPGSSTIKYRAGDRKKRKIKREKKSAKESDWSQRIN